MLTGEHGNLPAARAGALVSAVSTAEIMSRGLALQFRHAYPGSFRAYEYARRGRGAPGEGARA